MPRQGRKARPRHGTRSTCDAQFEMMYGPDGKPQGVKASCSEREWGAFCRHFGNPRWDHSDSSSEDEIYEDPAHPIPPGIMQMIRREGQRRRQHESTHRIEYLPDDSSTHGEATTHHGQKMITHGQTMITHGQTMTHHGQKMITNGEETPRAHARKHRDKPGEDDDLYANELYHRHIAGRLAALARTPSGRMALADMSPQEKEIFTMYTHQLDEVIKAGRYFTAFEDQANADLRNLAEKIKQMEGEDHKELLIIAKNTSMVNNTAAQVQLLETSVRIQQKTMEKQADFIQNLMDKDARLEKQFQQIAERVQQMGAQRAAPPSRPSTAPAAPSEYGRGAPARASPAVPAPAPLPRPAAAPAPALLPRPAAAPTQAIRRFPPPPHGPAPTPPSARGSVPKVVVVTIPTSAAPASSSRGSTNSSVYDSARSTFSQQSSVSGHSSVYGSAASSRSAASAPIALVPGPPPRAPLPGPPARAPMPVPPTRAPTRSPPGPAPMRPPAARGGQGPTATEQNYFYPRRPAPTINRTPPARGFPEVPAAAGETFERHYV